MKKLIKISPFIFVLFITLYSTCSYFLSNLKNISNFKTIGYYFLLNAGEGSYNDANEITIKNGKATLPAPSRKGYTFLGYSTTPDGNIDFNENIIDVELINNNNLYARWSLINYSITYNLNGGYLSQKKELYNIEESFSLPQPVRDGSTFLGWTGSNGDTPNLDVVVPKGTVGNLNYSANWNTQKFYVDVNPIIQNTLYYSGLDGFTFSVWINDNLVADHVIDYYNGEVEYGTKIRIYVYDRDGYSLKTFRDNTWIVKENINIQPEWYDDIPPTITSFSVTNLGYYDPKYGALKGWNIRVYIDGYDNGTGIQKYQTWLMPYGSGSGSARVDGNDRTLKNVLYLEEECGRTFCAYAIDNAGNEVERCETIRV